MMITKAIAPAMAQSTRPISPRHHTATSSRHPAPLAPATSSPVSLARNGATAAKPLAPAPSKEPSRLARKSTGASKGPLATPKSSVTGSAKPSSKSATTPDKSVSQPSMTLSKSTPTPPKSAAARAASRAKVANKASAKDPSESSSKESGKDGAKAGKMHRRSRSGCYTCRLRRKKCEEGRPCCRACNKLGIQCEYKRPDWWGNNERRRGHKEHIKERIRETKQVEKTQAQSKPVSSSASILAANAAAATAAAIAAAAAAGPSCMAHAVDFASPPGLSHSLPTSATYSDTAARTRAASEDSASWRIGDGLTSDSQLDLQSSQPFATECYGSFIDPSMAPPPPPPPATSAPIHLDPALLASCTSSGLHSLPAFHPHQSLPYEVDIKTERQMYVNDVPLRRESTTSTFSTFQPPPHGTLGTVMEEDWMPENLFDSHNANLFANGPGNGAPALADEGLEMDFFDFSNASAPTPVTNALPHASSAQPATSAVIQVDETDRPLLEHFVDRVLRLLFPVLELHQPGSVRAEVILPALESNRTYLHCCLSVAALHFKATRQLTLTPADVESLDADIVRHRYATVSELCEALARDTQHAQILEAALGMIFLPCAVGRPDDGLPDIAWHQHFEAASSLVRKLELPRLAHEATTTSPAGHPPFNMTLAAWIDILGATMLGRAPHFADHYREQHLSGRPDGLLAHDTNGSGSPATSGLRALMGCEDRLMYLISEMACLEALVASQAIDQAQMYAHITLLGHQLDPLEVTPSSLQVPMSSASESGGLRPRPLTQVITALFCIAARIYLCNLVPGAHRHGAATRALTAQFLECLPLLPGGPDGFDRCIVWPLLIVGAHAAPDTGFRHALAEREVALCTPSSPSTSCSHIQPAVEAMSYPVETGFPSAVPAMSSNVGTDPAYASAACIPRTSSNDAPVSGGSAGLESAGLGADLECPSGNGSLPAADSGLDAMGSFGRMAMVLREVWRLEDQECRCVHWRDVMRQHGWDFLLI